VFSGKDHEDTDEKSTRGRQGKDRCPFQGKVLPILPEKNPEVIYFGDDQSGKRDQLGTPRHRLGAEEETLSEVQICGKGGGGAGCKFQETREYYNPPHLIMKDSHD